MDFILYESTNDIALITINRPKQLNALNRKTLEELDSLLTDLQNDKKIKGIIITGAGEKAFVAGADINELAAANGSTGYDFAKFGQAVYNKIESMTIPVLAYINGYALGGGLELAMACHIRIASEKAKMGQPETKLGVIPGYGGTQRLPRIIGQGRAMELILTGKMINAADALSYGLVNEVVADDAGLSRAEEIVELISTNSPGANAKAILAINNGMQMTLPEALKYEASLFGLCCASPEKDEGTSAFLEKRNPDFKR